MTLQDIEAISAIYQCCEGAAPPKRFRLEHAKFAALCVELSRFAKTLREEPEESSWKPIFSFFSRYRYRVCSAPVPFSSCHAASPDERAEVSVSVRRGRVVSPSAAEVAGETLEAAAQLWSLDENPILDQIRYVARSLPPAPVILVRERHSATRTVEVLRNEPQLSNIPVLVPQELRGFTIYDSIIAVGPCSWFPDYVFSAPRSSYLCSVSFDCLSDSWRPRRAFALSDSSRVEQNSSLAPHMLPRDSLRELIGPAVDWDRAVSRARTYAEAGDDSELEEARLYLLEAGTVVALRALGNALVIDTREVLFSRGKARPVIARVNTDLIEADMFIVLRTGGSGDVLVPIADAIMGDSAVDRRKMEMRWKGPLAREIKRLGALEVAIHLLDQDSSIANETNVRNWASERNIRPEKFRDFRAIVKFVGLESEVKQLWDNAQAINSAHHRAGAAIRRMLMKQLLDTDLSALERESRIDFQLEGVEAGALTAFRVQDVREGTVTVPVDAIGELLSIEDGRWPS